MTVELGVEGGGPEGRLGGGPLGREGGPLGGRLGGGPLGKLGKAEGGGRFGGGPAGARTFVGGDVTGTGGNALLGGGPVLGGAVGGKVGGGPFGGIFAIGDVILAAALAGGGVTGGGANVGVEPSGAGTAAIEVRAICSKALGFPAIVAGGLAAPLVMAKTSITSLSDGMAAASVAVGSGGDGLCIVCSPGALLSVALAACFGILNEAVGAVTLGPIAGGGVATTAGRERFAEAAVLSVPGVVGGGPAGAGRLGRCDVVCEACEASSAAR